MARENIVFLYGKVNKLPTIICDKKSGEMLKASCHLTVVHGTRAIDDGSFGSFWYDCPQVVSMDPDLVYEMAQWKENDVVFVFGMLTTKNIKKSTVCPHCGYKNENPGVLSYVTPIHCMKIQGGLSDQEAKENLKKNGEMSNRCILIGNVCSDPVFHRNSDNGFCQDQYQIAINRKIRIKEDPAEKKTDFPWVKSNGPVSINDANFLMKGSSLLVNGYLQTREFVQKGTCKECKNEYSWNENTMEAVPYSNEYLKGFRSAEEIRKENEESGNSLFEQVFS